MLFSEGSQQLAAQPFVWQSLGLASVANKYMITLNTNFAFASLLCVYRRSWNSFCFPLTNCRKYITDILRSPEIVYVKTQVPKCVITEQQVLCCSVLLFRGSVVRMIRFMSGWPDNAPNNWTLTCPSFPTFTPPSLFAPLNAPRDQTGMSESVHLQVLPGFFCSALQSCPIFFCFPIGKTQVEKRPALCGSFHQAQCTFSGLSPSLACGL